MLGAKRSGTGLHDGKCGFGAGADAVRGRDSESIVGPVRQAGHREVRAVRGDVLAVANGAARKSIFRDGVAAVGRGRTPEEADLARRALRPYIRNRGGWGRGHSLKGCGKCARRHIIWPATRAFSGEGAQGISRSHAAAYGTESLIPFP